MPALASSPSVVSDAIHRFAREVRRSPELAGRLGYARAWYAEQRGDGRWSFGPSKFVGYEELDAETYLERSRRGLDGRRTEVQLGRWFREVDPSSELFALLSSKLSAFLAQHGKAPSQKLRISVGNEAYDVHLGIRRDQGDSPLVDLVVAVATTLPSSELKTLRKRLKAVGG